jgi:RNA-directed DNA polymerase
MSTVSKPRGKATYVASSADRYWLLTEQRKLYTRSWEEPRYTFAKLWGLVTDLRNLRCALMRVSRNKGSRTAGVDGVTVRKILAGDPEGYLKQIREELRKRTYQPNPVRKLMIPKPGKPGKFRPLGIPTVTDRIVQSALKNMLEPIFEADFYPCSYGFRPERGVHGALEHARKFLKSPKLKEGTKTEVELGYQIAIEADVKGCFDNLSHHGIMTRVRRRISDNKVNRLILSFLQAGAMSEEGFLRTQSGTPQGGILSPLLANIALSAIEERYERYLWPRFAPTFTIEQQLIKSRACKNRALDKKKGQPTFALVRYADDFIIFVSAPKGPNQLERAKAIADKEKVALARDLKDKLGLELSESKTFITPVTAPLRFLGHHVRVQRHRYYGWISNTVIPKDRSQLLRETIKSCFDKHTTHRSLESRLKIINPVLRGWANFYRHARGAKQVFRALDWYIWWVIKRWLQKKHYQTPMNELYARYGTRELWKRSVYWGDGETDCFRLSTLQVQHFRHQWQRTPDFAETSMESPVHNERCTPGLEEWTSETAG